MKTSKNIILLLLLIGAHTAVFWLSDLDLRVAAFFYHPEQANPWPLGEQAFWKFFYHLGPMLTISIAISALIVILFSGLKKTWSLYRYQAAFVLFSFLLGPGLIVNTVFKDHWGRDRPINVEQFAGTKQYTPPLYYSPEGEGKSFPSGHSSLGFGFIAFWFIWRKRRKLWAGLALGFSLGLGSLLGLSRMAAGGHFLSDVFWSLWIPLLTSMALYTLFFQKYLDAEPNELPPTRGWKNLIYSALALLVLAYGLFNWPIQHSQQYQIAVPSSLHIVADKTHLQLRDNRADSDVITIEHHVNGFGLPFSMQTLSIITEGNITNLRLESQGFFSELESTTTLRLPAERMMQTAPLLEQGK